ncbi:helix-turn-helix domain-containing protein [Cryobacterium sp. 10I1]|uniref:helix-turn-helix domain-containing protein n=1 Tax=Cryobacterium sp. 10I1 TaxID=3048578 RepID=UPI003A5987AC
MKGALKTSWTLEFAFMVESLPVFDIMSQGGTNSTPLSCTSCTREASVFDMTSPAPTPTPTTPSEGIRALRNLAGLTLDQVAERAGTSAAYLSRVERGERRMTPKMIGRVTTVIAAQLSLPRAA